MIACKNCKYFGWGRYSFRLDSVVKNYFLRKYEYAVTCDFFNGDVTFRNTEGKPLLYHEYHREIPVSMCHHPVCFSYYVTESPVDIMELHVVRVNGQAILNRNNNCPFYKKSWWGFWV